MRIKLFPCALAAIVAFVASLPEAASAGSLVDLEFCNKFGQTVYVAIAYPQSNDHWVSRGWMSVGTGECESFDTALHVPTFYVRAQTDWYRSGRRRRSRETWGDKGSRAFALVESSGGSFNYYQAETRFAGVANEPFFQFFQGTQLTLDRDAHATVTFNADGSTSADIVPINPPSGGPPPSGESSPPPKHSQ